MSNLAKPPFRTEGQCKKFCKSSKKIYLCSAPGCNVPTYNGSRFCECHKHNYKYISAPMIKKMFPNQRTIPMVGIYGAFWQRLHEYMNKLNTKITIFCGVVKKHDSQ